MTISRHIIDQNEVVDLWRLESNDFDEWEYGSIPISSIKDSFEVSTNNYYLYEQLHFEKKKKIEESRAASQNSTFWGDFFL